MNLGQELRALNVMKDFGSWMKKKKKLGRELRVLNALNDFASWVR